MSALKTYTFKGIIQTMTFYQDGTVSASGESEEEAREKAINKVCRIHRIGRNCFKLYECVKVE